MQDELTLVDCSVQLVEHGEAAAHRAGQCRLPCLRAVGAARFGFLQSHIEVAEHIVFGVLTVARDQVADAPPLRARTEGPS